MPPLFPPHLHSQFITTRSPDNGLTAFETFVLIMWIIIIALIVLNGVTTVWIYRLEQNARGNKGSEQVERLGMEKTDLLG